jgi:hypothetical protein
LGGIGNVNLNITESPVKCHPVGRKPDRQEHESKQPKYDNFDWDAPKKKRQFHAAEYEAIGECGRIIVLAGGSIRLEMAV